MQRALSIDQSPPLALTLPFFLNIPLFSLAAALLAVEAGPELFASRWHPAALAFTHAWTLGVLGSAMLGSLLHILAVAGNVRVGLSPRSGLALWSLLSAGVLLLMTGFIAWQQWAWLAAALSLGIALPAYLILVSAALWRQRRAVLPGIREILVPVRLSLTFLALTVLSGLVMLFALGTGKVVPDLLDAHVVAGLAGWSGLLLMAMSFQLLPIFQVTELFPRSLVRWLPWGVAALLAARWSIASLPGPWQPLRELMDYLILLAFALWGVVTWSRLWRRKRAQADTSTLFWYSSLASLLICVPLLFWLNTGSAQGAALGIGFLVIIGALGSVVIGMLYTIVPFLLWREAQQAVTFNVDEPERTREMLRLIPKTGQYMPARIARLHWVVHSASVPACAGAALGVDWLGVVAAPLLLSAACLLGWNLGSGWRRYRQCRRALAVYQGTTDSTPTRTRVASPGSDARPRCPE